MLKIVAQFKGEYAAKPRDQKRLYVETALEAVLKDGARFLRRVETTDGSHKWEEVDRAAAAEKVWHVLRSKGEARNKKARRTSEQGDDHAHSDHTQLPNFSGLGNTGENPTGSNFYFQQPPVIQGAMSMQHLSLVQSLSNALLQHLSNATAAAVLLAAITAGQVQLPPPPSTPAAENAGMSSSEDQSAQNVAQLLAGELLRAQAPGTTLNSLASIQPQVYQHASGSYTTNPAAAGARSSRDANPSNPIIPQNLPINHGGQAQQTQLIQVISSLLRVAEQLTPQQQQTRRQPPAPPSHPRNSQPQI
jgi:hypothetical protein